MPPVGRFRTVLYAFIMFYINFPVNMFLCPSINLIWTHSLQGNISSISQMRLSNPHGARRGSYRDPGRSPDQVFYILAAPPTLRSVFQLCKFKTHVCPR